jgi:hypothetical protein
VKSVAPEVAPEVDVLFEYKYLDPGSGEEIAEHHARRSTTGNAGPDRHSLHDPSECVTNPSSAPLVRSVPIAGAPTCRSGCVVVQRTTTRHR